MKRNIKSLKLDQIRTDGGTQSRVAIDQGAVDDYALALENGEVLPEPVVFFDGAAYWLADGFHRVHANRKIGARAMDVDQREGTLADAVFFAAGANKSHGLRRSNADKRQAVRLLLQSPAHTGLSNREVSRQCGVSHTFVSLVANDLAETAGNKRATGNVATKDAPRNAAPSAEAGNSSSAEGGNVASARDQTGDSSRGSVVTVTTSTPEAGSVATARGDTDRRPGPATLAAAGAAQATDSPAPEDDFDLAAEFQMVLTENEGLRAQLASVGATDQGAEIVKLRQLLEHARREQTNSMQVAAQRERELKWYSQALARIGKAVGESDPKKVVGVVEALIAASHA